MDIAISKVCSHASDAEKGKIDIRPDIPFVPESTLESDRTGKNNGEFILVTRRYRPSTRDFKKNNYVMQAKCFVIGTIEDVLCWYITLQDVCEENPCHLCQP